jgi:ankyrin repeat protein/Tfp pilus assembly protein PilF
MNRINDELIFAASTGNFQSVLKSINSGAFLDATDRVGNTALLYASFNNYTEIVKILLSKGADANIKNRQGTTSLVLFADNGNYEIVKLLLEADALPNIQDNLGWTPLMCAARHGHAKVISQLLHYRASVDSRNIDGSTALMYAVENGHEDAVHELLLASADPNTLNKSGSCALNLAAEYSSEKIVEMLLNNGGDINLKNPLNFNSLMHFAAQSGQIPTMKILITKGIDINAVNKDGSTPLMSAVLMNQNDAVKLLLNHNADLNISANNGVTAMAIACSHNTEAIDLLLNKGATLKEGIIPFVSITDKDTSTNPSQISLEWFNKGIASSKNKDWDGAIMNFVRATSNEPTFADAWYAKGVAQLNVNNLVQAKKSFNEAVKLNSQHYKAYYNLAIIFEKDGKYKEALDEYENALNAKPDLEEAWNNKGHILLTLNQIQEAEKCFEKAVNLDPKDKFAWFNLGVSLNLQAQNYDDFKRAISCFETARDLGHNDAEEEIKKCRELLEQLEGMTKQSYEIKKDNKICKRCGYEKGNYLYNCEKCDHTQWLELIIILVFSLLIVYGAYIFNPPLQNKFLKIILSIIRWGIIGIFSLTLLVLLKETTKGISLFIKKMS